MKYSYEEIACMIDHSLLHPAMTDRELEEGCKLALEYKVASVCIKPYALPLAVKMLKGSEVAAGTVVGFPHGGNTIEVKKFETDEACRLGAQEIDMVLNIGKALSGVWKYVEQEIRSVVEIAHSARALVKVIFENDFLTNDAVKIQLCKIAENAGANFVKTSTGYGFVKQKDGGFLTRGATESDIRLMRASTSPRVQVKAAGGVRDLNAVIHMKELGATRVGASATAAILEEFKSGVKQQSQTAGY